MTLPLGLLSIPHNVGYLALAGLVGAESAGVPVPGETTLITAAALAKAGSLSIVWVIAIAAAAAIIGDNVGYLVARRVGRTAFVRPGPWQQHRRATLERGEAFFDRHGPKAVFFGRWVLGLRIWASWLAGMTRMPWPQFLLWNALGGVSWAVTVGVAGYLLGAAAERIFGTGGILVAVAVSLLVMGILAAWHLRGRRRQSRGRVADAPGN